MKNYTRSLGVTLVILASLVMVGARPSLRNLQALVEDLQAQFEELQAVSDADPVVVDGAGTVVGPVIGVIGTVLMANPWVQVDLPGLPIFAVQVQREEILGNDRPLMFESDNCTGQPWTEMGQTAWGNVIRLLDSATTRKFYVSDPADDPEMIFVLSQLRNFGECDPNDFHALASRLTPVDLDEMFAPPFQVSTRARLQAQP